MLMHHDGTAGDGKCRQRSWQQRAGGSTHSYRRRSTVLFGPSFLYFLFSAAVSTGPIMTFCWCAGRVGLVAQNTFVMMLVVLLIKTHIGTVLVRGS